MQAKLIGYQHRDTVIHRLSGAGKLSFSFWYHWRP
ncbi:ABC transporter permease [Streptococcus pneumoniae]|nr:ABC transporter permease [Streptococcus pneumoniae]